ncbi:response regulator [Anaerolineales bacterium HSG6]|nr:response regulator [Anaerolineales bacterium HSG6]MDM8533053.1 response regulator [Anaerolineales bacterium HSG25]
MDRLRVLVVDDSKDIRDFVIEYILEPQGFEIEVAFDGMEGLHKATTNPPDLILTDYEMPKMTGPEMIRNLRNQGSKVPIILMTAQGSEALAIEVFRLGVHDYVPKPFMPEDMLDAIEGALAVARLKQEKDSLMKRLMVSNQNLEQRVGELNVLYQVGKSITTLMPPGKMLERIVDATLFVTEGHTCKLVLVDPVTRKITEQVQKTREGQTPQPDGQVFSVPLTMGKTAVGTLSLIKQVDEEFSDHDERLLRMLADYGSIAIHNMQLMYQVQKSKEREKKQIRDLFERYVSPTLVEQMLARPDLVKLGGSREQVAIVFADVRGFSTFSNSISPEKLVELLNQYMRVAADAILAEGGTLDKFMGDAVMAFFNAPLAQDDYPFRAVRAAWALQQSVAQVHDKLPPKYRLEFGVGVGVGEAVVGNIGTARLMNFTVIGDAVNKVKRLQESAKGGQILIDTDTYELLGNQIQAQDIGNMHLKGQKFPEPVYEILSVDGQAKITPPPTDDFLDLNSWEDLTTYTARV